MDNEEKLKSIKNGDWHWLNSKVIYSQLIERLETYEIEPDEIVDILRVAFVAAQAEEVFGD